jgi:GT2 family glycosyltransferase
MITISIISHGQEKFLKTIINDLFKKEIQNLNIVITHNLRQSKELKIEADIKEKVCFIENPYPKGFGANHNAAFKYCQGEWFAVINPDIRLDADIFSRLIEHARPQDGVIAPALVDPTKMQISQCRDLLTPWEVIRRRLPCFRPPREPVWMPGAFLLFRAEAFRDVGGFDERYYLYAEDFDICARLRLNGWLLNYIPEVKAFHAAQRASHVRPRYLLWHIESLLKLWRSDVFWQYRALLRSERSQRPR